MPKNRLIYAGVLIIASAAVLWVAARLLERVDWALYGTAIIGVVLVVVGLVMEAVKGKEALKIGNEDGEPLIPISEPTTMAKPEPMPADASPYEYQTDDSSRPS